MYSLQSRRFGKKKNVIGMFSLMLSIVRASCRVDLKSKSHVEKWDVDGSWWRVLWIISDLCDYASRLVQMIGTSRDYGTPIIKLKWFFFSLKSLWWKKKTIRYVKHINSRAIWVLKISSPACLSRPSVPFASMGINAGLEARGWLKTSVASSYVG